MRASCFPLCALRQHTAGALLWFHSLWGQKQEKAFFFSLLLCERFSSEAPLPLTSLSQQPRVHIPEPAKVSGPVRQHDTLQPHTKNSYSEGETLTRTVAAQQVAANRNPTHTVLHTGTKWGKLWSETRIMVASFTSSLISRCWPTHQASLIYKNISAPHNHRPAAAKTSGGEQNKIKKKSLKHEFWLSLRRRHSSLLIWRSAALAGVWVITYSCLTLWRWHKAKSIFCVHYVKVSEEKEIRKRGGREAEELICHLSPPVAQLFTFMPIKHGEMKWR